MTERERIELDLVRETAACRACTWFWSPLAFDPVPLFDGSKRVRRLGPIEPAMLRGCRKAPIMTIGINPNMSSFFASPGGSAAVYPWFGEDLKARARYYRYAGVNSERMVDLQQLKGFVRGEEERSAGTVRGISRLNSHRYAEITVSTANGTNTRVVTWREGERPVFFKGPGDNFQVGDAVFGVLGANAFEGATEGPKVESHPEPYYERMQGVLARLKQKYDLTNLAVGEDVCQLDMVACASPGWSSSKYDMPLERVVQTCVVEKSFFFKQLLHTRPQVIVFSGNSALKMFGATLGHYLDFDWVDRDIYELLYETSSYRRTLSIPELNFTARVLCSPHFSYADNFVPQLRFSPEAWHAFTGDFPKAAAVLAHRIAPSVDNDSVVLRVDIDRERGSLELSESSWRALEAHSYDALTLLSQALAQEIDAKQLTPVAGHLRRSKGDCKFCTHFELEGGCEYEAQLSEEQDLVPSVVSRSLVREKRKSETLDAAPPAAARVWCGHASVDRARFQKELGETFVPATVYMMAPLGLNAYLPALLPEAEGLPDEVALVFYPSVERYEAASQTPLGRAYRALHGSMFRFDASGASSRSAFPTAWAPELALKPDQPMYLFGRPLDWQSGSVALFAGHCDEQALRTALLIWKNGSDLRPRPNECIFVRHNGYIVLWTHWSSRPEPDWHAALQRGGEPALVFAAVAELIHFPTRPDITAPNLSLSTPTLWNIRFDRSKECATTAPPNDPA